MTRSHTSTWSLTYREPDRTKGKAMMATLIAKLGQAVPTDDKVCQQNYAGCMATMNVSLPDGLKEFVEAQVAELGYGTSSEFIRDLIRREQGRAQLRALLVDGMGSGPGSEMDGPYFERLRERIRSSSVA